MGKKSRKKKVARERKQVSASVVGKNSPGNKVEPQAALPQFSGLAAIGPIVLLSVAMAISAYLVSVSFSTGKVAGCADGASCSVVLGSKWSKILGLPIALTGLLTYGIILLKSKAIRAGDRGLWTSMALAAMLMVPLAAVWFGVVQLFILKAFCPWCCATHFVATCGVLWLYLQRRKSRAGADQRELSKNAIPTGWIPMAAVMSMVLLVTLQASSEEPEGIEIAKVGGASIQPADKSDDPDAPRFLSLHDGDFKVDIKDVPIIGSPQADHVMAIITDYSCGHCRKLHKMLEEVQASHGDDRLAVAILPGMKNQKSLQIFRSLLPLWKAHPETFKAVDAALYEGKLAFTPEAVAQEIEKQLVGVQIPPAMMQAGQNWANRLIQTSARIFAKNAEVSGRKVLPQLLVGDEVIVGASKNINRYHRLVNQHFELRDRSDPLIDEDFKKKAELAKAEKEKKEALASNSKKSNEVRSEAGPGDGQLKLHEGKFTVNALDLPVIGSPKAEHLAGLLFDYTCPHCRHVHHMMEKVQGTWKDEELGIVMIPGVRNKLSVDIHRIMLAVWKANSAVYHEMTEELLTKKMVANPTVIRAQAESRVGATQFGASEKSHKSWIDQQLTLSQKIYAENATKKKGGFPQLMAGDELSVGAYPKDLYYYALFQRQFGLVSDVYLAAQKKSEKKVAPKPESAPRIPPVPVPVKQIPAVAKVATPSAVVQKKDIAAIRPTRGKDVSIVSSREGSALSFHSDQFTVDSAELPIWGEPSAKQVLTLLIDFQSRQCLKAAGSLLTLQEKSTPGELAVTLLPAMPSGKAQQIHRELLVLWKHNPDAYRALVTRMVSGELAMTPEAAQKVVADQLGADALKISKSHAGWVQSQLVTTHRIFAANRRLIKNASLPHLLTETRLFAESLPAENGFLLSASQSRDVEGKGPVVLNKN